MKICFLAILAPVAAGAVMLEPFARAILEVVR